MYVFNFAPNMQLRNKLSGGENNHCERVIFN